MRKLKINQDYTSESTLEDIEKLVKPDFLVIVISTLVCLGPYGHLIFDIIIKDYSRLLFVTLLTFPTLVLMSFSWCWYFYRINHYKKVASELFEEINKS